MLPSDLDRRSSNCWLPEGHNVFNVFWDMLICQGSIWYNSQIQEKKRLHLCAAVESFKLGQPCHLQSDAVSLLIQSLNYTAAPNRPGQWTDRATLFSEYRSIWCFFFKYLRYQTWFYSILEPNGNHWNTSLHLLYQIAHYPVKTSHACRMI